MKKLKNIGVMNYKIEKLTRKNGECFYILYKKGYEYDSKHLILFKTPLIFIVVIIILFDYLIWEFKSQHDTYEDAFKCLNNIHNKKNIEKGKKIQNKKTVFRMRL